MADKLDVNSIDPASIMDVGVPTFMEDGSVTVTLLTRYVPLEQVDSLGRVIATGIGKYIGLTEAEAEILADRVAAHLALATRESLREPGLDPTTTH